MLSQALSNIQVFVETHAYLFTILSLIIPLIDTIIRKSYSAITKKVTKNSSLSLFFMFIISLTTWLALLYSQASLDRLHVAMISAHTVVLIFILLIFMVSNQKINALHFAKAKHGLFDIDYLDD